MKKVGRPDTRPMREKTLEELEGFVAGEPPYDTYLVRTIHALRKKPIRDFTTEDLRITIGQGRGIPYLLPLALERLEADPFAEGHLYRGDLLMSVLYVEAHWSANAEIRGRVGHVIERVLDELSRVEPFHWGADELPDPDKLDESDRSNLERRLREALGRLREAE